VATFVYQVKDRAGKVTTGNLDGDSASTVSAKLRQMGYVVLSLNEKQDSLGAVSLKIPGFGGGKVKVKALTVFTRQFATMVNSGLSLTKCLGILSTQTESAVLRGIVGQVQKDVEGGMSLSDSLARHPKTFPPIFTNMVRAGEAGGVLDEVLLRVADHFEKDGHLKAKIKSAMTYPIGMAVFMVLILVAMLSFVVPVFVTMFTTMGGDLPGPTKVLVGMSDFIRTKWWLIIIVGVAISWAYRTYKATPGGRMTLDRMKLRAPIFGELVRKIALAKFTRTFGTLISAGVPILQALDIVADTAGNEVVAEAVKKARGSIKEGETIAKPLSESKVFPAMVVQMIAVGEETGALDTMLNKIADFYDEEVSNMVDAMTSLIEPLMIGVMGLSAGFMIIALYMPMFKVVTLIK
jgi:type IV pilus assembly protein PilC